MRKMCLDMVYELAKKDKKLFFIGSDLGIGTMDHFKREMPERFFMEGVSEANIIGMAAGLANEGKIVYVNTIASFITRRCFEQNLLDLGFHNANVRLIGNGGGVVYAPLGPTHEATEDIAIMRAIPNMTILAPADAEEMKRLMPLTVDHVGPIYIRVAKGYDPIVTDDSHTVKIGEAVTFKKGPDGLIITTGRTLQLALDAHADLMKDSIKTTILHLPTIKPLDVKSIIDCCKASPFVITVEEHSIIGGLGTCIAEVIADNNIHVPFKRLALKDEFIQEYGSQLEIMKSKGVSSDNIIETVKELKAQR